MDATGESVRRLSDFGFDPSFSPDGREIVVGSVGFLLVRDRNGISLVDAVTGRTKTLVEVSGYFTGYSLGVTHDDRWITYTETATDGDIWLMTLE